MADDVSDSTDWLVTPLPDLSAVESALRCQVCKDFYQTPMMTECSHTFCSVCIRRALSNDGKCPMCRSSQQESKLRNNSALGEVVEAFAVARPKVLGLVLAPPAVASHPAPNNQSSSPKRRLHKIHEPNKRIRTSARLSRLRGAQVTASMAQQDAVGITINLADESDRNDSSYEPPDDGLVACPICLQRMKEHAVSQHLDATCPGEPQTNILPPQPSAQTKVLSRKQAAQTLERLPALSYSMLKEPALRKKMVDLGIPSHGNRQILERRHREWMTIWNANCDSAIPKTKSKLKGDLETWERTQGTLAPSSSKAAVVGSQIKDKGFDGQAWARKHDDLFKNLITNARRSKGVAKDQPSDVVAQLADGQAEGPVTKVAPLPSEDNIKNSPQTHPHETHIPQSRIFCESPSLPDQPVLQSITIQPRLTLPGPGDELIVTSSERHQASQASGWAPPRPAQGNSMDISF